MFFLPTLRNVLLTFGTFYFVRGWFAKAIVYSVHFQVPEGPRAASHVVIMHMPDKFLSKYIITPFTGTVRLQHAVC